ncbi:hypothetical protein JCM5296_007443 [Sporobolomyces johnsonii]
MPAPAPPPQPLVARTEAPAELSNPGLVLLYGDTPNGWKITYALNSLKEAGAIPDYTVVPVFLQTDEQFNDWFIKINPNSRMPALIDNRADKPPIHIWESASILLYLARTYDTAFNYHFEDDDLHQEMLNFMFFIQAGLGPMQGQANHFYRYAPVTIDYAVDRYQNETKRLYGVYEDHLSGKHDGKQKEFLVGDKLSYADFCTQPWLRPHFWAGLSLDPFPHLKAYMDRVEAVPSIANALKVPDVDLVTKIKNNPDLERQIMERMKKAREAKEEKARKEAVEGAAKGGGKAEQRGP